MDAIAATNGSTVRSRRSHTKSRLGCLECKRRRIKCDEVRPACGRCIATFHNCQYAPFRQSFSRFVSRRSSPSSSDSHPSASPHTSSPQHTPHHPTKRPAAQQGRSSASDGHRRTSVAWFDGPVNDHTSLTSDEALYQHYLAHTGRTLPSDSRDVDLMQVDLPVLAQHSLAISHALRAVSAVCICCDLMSADQAEPNVIREVLRVGYDHYQRASEQMRALMTGSGDLEQVAATSMLLVPFAGGTQQVLDWLSRSSDISSGSKYLATTPRDIVTMVRGVRAIFDALSSEPRWANSEPLSLGLDPGRRTREPSLESCTIHHLNRHCMFTMLAQTSAQAFDTLRRRIDLADDMSRSSTGGISACRTAFGILDDIRKDMFLSSATASGRRFAGGPGAQSVPWLSEGISKSTTVNPGTPLTRPLLSFLVDVPQEYLDLLLTLLEERLTKPIEPADLSGLRKLTEPQLLALDVYAHWSTLMFLVEDENWWIGSLPTITLEGLINRYGHDLSAVAQVSGEQDMPQWWPGSILKIMKELKQFNKGQPQQHGGMVQTFQSRMDNQASRR